MLRFERRANELRYGNVAPLTESEKLEFNIRQMREALELIRSEAATKENGGAWAGGIATLCLGTLQR